jgi:hypothetical protein
MKSKPPKTIFAALLLCTGLALPVIACSACPNCSPVVNCVAPVQQPGPGSPEFESSGPQAEPAAVVSNTQCTTNTVCAGSGPGAAFPCQAHTGICDVQAQRCKLKLAAGKQCVPGSVRNCTTPDNVRGVTRCDSSCDFPSPAAGGCQACGSKIGEKCCVGGCDPGFKCSDPTNPPSATCEQA